MAEAVNAATGEVVEVTALAVSAPADMSMARRPDVVLAEARTAAKALAEVISSKAKAVIINGKQYLEFEDWQTLGRFYGITAKTVDTNPVSFDGVRGFEARAVALYRGTEISAAEAMCLDDEDRWGDRPMFQLRSMAQTRACVKALRNVLAWVVVMAGYAGTPAEEMDSEKRTKGPEPNRRAPRADARKGAPKPGHVISEKQRGLLFKVMERVKCPPEKLKAHVKATLGIEHSSEIKMDDFQGILHWLDPKAFDAPEVKNGKKAAPEKESPQPDDTDGPIDPDDEPKEGELWDDDKD